jgi:hypothetical protein
MYRYCSLVSAADDITAPFTSQTSPVYPTVIFTIFNRVVRLSPIAWFLLKVILKSLF